MKVQFLGAVRTVTGSMHLLTVNGSRILLDCGLVQGRRKESFERNRNLPFDPKTIDTMILSHAHIDHSGNIPSLVKNGFRGNIFTTPASRDLCSAMLRDAGHIQEQDTIYVNKQRARRGQEPLEPLYTVEDATASLGNFVSLGYDRPLLVSPGVTLSFRDAGHILGSAVTVLDIQEGDEQTRLVFSGDLGRAGKPILRDPQLVDDVDYLIIESTYGDRRHPPIETTDEALKDVVLKTYRRGGKVIVPAFSVGRTQELVYALHRLIKARDLPELPIFVDSPLSVNVTEIFRLHPECYDEELKEFMADNHYRDPFGFQRLTYIRSVEQSKELNFLQDPAIIISASGMCEAGRILHHLKNNIEDPRNTVLIVGWQSPYTLGRRLVEHKPKVKIFGEEYRLNADVETINGFSAHADRDGLQDYVRQLGAERLKGVFVVHGEEPASLAAASSFRDIGAQNTVVPQPGEEIQLSGA